MSDHASGLIVNETGQSVRGRTKRLPVNPEQRKDRLHQLAANYNVSRSDPRIQLNPAQVICFHQDETAVDNALKEYRQDKIKSSRRYKFLKIRQTSPKSKDATATLAKFVRNGCPAGQAKRLTERGANVNFSQTRKKGLWRSLIGTTRDEKRSDVLETATELCSADVLAALAPNADSENLNKALAVALGRRNLNSMNVLLHFGADPNPFALDIKELVQRSQTDYVTSLASAKKCLNSDLATEALVPAIFNQDLKTVQLMLWHGADTNHDGGATLSRAANVKAARLIAALCIAPKPPSSITLASALSNLGDGSQSWPEADLDMAEMILATGVGGKVETGIMNEALPRKIQQVLIDAVEREDYSLVELLVAYGASTPSQMPRSTGAQAISRAIEKGNMRLFGELLSKQLSPEMLQDVLPTIQRCEAISPDVRLEMLRKTILQRPNQQTLDLGLFFASQKADIREAEILTQNGASTNHDNGQALFLAISKCDISLFTVLVPVTPKTSIKLRAVEILKSTQRHVRLSMMRILFQTSIRGKEVDEALLHIMSEPASNTDYELLEILVSNANVDISRGECFKIGASRGDIKALDILLQGGPEPHSVGYGLFASCSIVDDQIRYTTMQCLSTRDAGGNGLDEALITSVNKDCNCLKFLTLLRNLGANVSANSGKALENAVTHHNNGALQLLVGGRPTQTILDGAAQQVLRAENSSWRLEAMKILTRSGVSQSILNQALVGLMDEPRTDRELIHLCLSSSANVDFKDGRALTLAVEKQDPELFETLCSSHELKPVTVQHTISYILNQEDRETIFSLSETLIQIQTQRFRLNIGSQLGILLPHAISQAPLLQLFLRHAAIVEMQESQAVRDAVAASNLSALEELLSYAENASFYKALAEWDSHHSPEPGGGFDVLATILEVEKHRNMASESRLVEQKNRMLLSEVNSNQRDISRIRLLLDHQSSVHAFGSKCLRDALKRLDVPVLDFLLGYSTNRSVPTLLFDSASSEDFDWSDSDSLLRCFRVLLKYPIAKDSVHKALIEAVRRLDASNTDYSFLDLFLQNEASADFMSGASLLQSARLCQVKLWERLVKAAHASTSFTDALPLLLKCHSGNSELLEILEIIKKRLGSDLVLDSVLVDGHQLLFWSINYSRDATLFAKLLDLGASPDQCASAIWEEKVGQEMVSVLTLTIIMSLKNPRASFYSQVVKQLLLKNANVNFQTSTSLKTPLLLAVEHASQSIVQTLLQYNANVNVQDSQGRSPLFIASSRDDTSTVACLLNAGAKSNDGSLSEAARSCNADAVKQLLKHNHDPNFSSGLHERRGPLDAIISIAELPPGVGEWKVTETIKALVNGGARYDHQGKPLLFLALDSPCASVMTNAVLSAFLGNRINDPINIYQTEGYTRSAVTYVEHGLNKQPNFSSSAQRQQYQDRLLRILKNYGAKRVWYCNDGDQPDDYERETAPPHIRRREDERRERIRQQHIEDEERNRRIQASKAEAEHEQTLRHQEHKLTLAIEADQLRHQEDVQNQRLAGTLQRQKEKTLEEERLAQWRRNAQLEHEQREAQLRYDIQAKDDKQRQKRLESESSIRKRERQDREASEQRLLESKESASRRHHQRELENILATERLVGEQKRLAIEAKGAVYDSLRREASARGIAWRDESPD